MKQEHRTTPPADDTTSPPRVCPLSCDATAQKYASPRSITRSKALEEARDTRLTTSRPREEIGRETPAQEVGTANGTEKSGEKALTEGIAIQSATQSPTSANQASTEKLRRRYLDSGRHSFPTYGNPRSGVPIPNPMSRSMRSLLTGDFQPKNDLNSKGHGGSSKRVAQSLTTHIEPTRSSKRQKTVAQTESPSNHEYSSAQFVVALPSASSRDRSPSLKASSVVDLTESQKSRDGDTASHRSEYDPLMGASEFRQLEKKTRNGATTTKKRPRNRKLMCKQTSPAQYEVLSEDELGRDEEQPPKKRNDITRKVLGYRGYQLPNHTRGASEGISDGDLQRIGELAKSQSKPAQKAKSRRIVMDPISDDDAKISPTTPGSRGTRADISPVTFSKKGGKSVSPVFRLKRAVAASLDKWFDAGLDAAPELSLRVDNKFTLMAVDSTGARRDDYHWLEVKLNLCDGIQHTTYGPPIAAVKRPSKRGLLVLEFAESGNALTFGLWANAALTETSTLKCKVEEDDSDRLQKVMEKQWEITVNRKPRTETQPDDIKYLENKEANSANNWEKIWDDHKPLIFPASGKYRTTIYKDDIARLEEGEFMNDNLIGFYSRYLQIKLEQENKQAADRIYFMNTYFYPKLTEKRGRGINYDGVKTWTAKVDIFSYDYIIVPINEQAHWYLAIICHPSKLVKSDEIKEEDVESAQLQETPKEGLVSTVGEQVEHMTLDDANATQDTPKTETSEPNTMPAKSHPFVKKSSGALPRKKDPSEARVITLDSLATGHSATCGNLKDYLVREALDKRGLEIQPPSQFGMTAKNIPEQLDHASCGAFLLGYLREFLKGPDDVVSRIVRKEDLGWDISSLEMRGELRSIIIEQRKEQNERNAKLAAEKRARKKSNILPPASSKSPEKESSGPPATPRTPTSVDDVPKNPSSTIKGSPSVTLKDHSSSPAKKATDGGIPILEEDGPHKPTVATGSVPGGESNDAVQALESNPPEQPKTPVRSRPPHRAASSPCQVRSSPRHNKIRMTSSADKSQAASLSQVLSSSGETSVKKMEPASSRFKQGLKEAEQVLSQLSSPSKPMPIRAERRASEQHEPGDSPSQQLLSELQASPSKSGQVDHGVFEGFTQPQRLQTTVEDQELSKKSSPGAMPTGAVHTSSQFAAPIMLPTEPSHARSPPVKSPSVRTPPGRRAPAKYSPASHQKVRQPSLEEVPMPSVEDNETYDQTPGGSKYRKPRHVTVDLTEEDSVPTIPLDDELRRRTD
ncbi:ulp1 protease family protein [Colletotrichum karsti]|uniref:Ulp1 protease family protein n=1 Tax=Colletotrichum karsti TaxID=1095194 RepID=A0A9P6LQ00_9PEZI|nr:ulp1 protease family protein [Colletotrichum karsti]KAF9881041.1 ulp1 protease family protein [Colletotrichum karsti]